MERAWPAAMTLAAANSVLRVEADAAAQVVACSGGDQPERGSAAPGQVRCCGRC